MAGLAPLQLAVSSIVYFSRSVCVCVRVRRRRRRGRSRRGRGRGRGRRCWHGGGVATVVAAVVAGAVVVVVAVMVQEVKDFCLWKPKLCMVLPTSTWCTSAP